MDVTTPGVKSLTGVGTWWDITRRHLQWHCPHMQPSSMGGKVSPLRTALALQKTGVNYPEVVQAQGFPAQ
jgi:hypothetical protein